MHEPQPKKPSESTITGDDWRRSLARARIRRKGARQRIHNNMKTTEKLIQLGWTEYKNWFGMPNRQFCKRYDTPTKCCLNNEKAGIQVTIYVSNHKNRENMELEIVGELSDGTWVRLANQGLPDDVDATIKLIPRLLNMWETAASATRSVTTDRNLINQVTVL